MRLTSRCPSEWWHQAIASFSSTTILHGSAHQRISEYIDSFPVKPSKYSTNTFYTSANGYLNE